MAEYHNPISLKEDEEISMSGFSVSESIPVEDSAYDSGNEEAQRFFTQFINQELDYPPDFPVVSSLKYSCNTEFMIKLCVKNLEQKCTDVAHLMCCRDTVKFWELLFRQTVNLSTNEKVISAGKAGDGGLYQEFLLFVEQNFIHLLIHLFGANRFAFFSSFPVHVLAKRYILLGQTYARLILHTGRGPRCLHPLLVKANFEHSSDVLIHLNQFERVLLNKIK